jgi:hypothetical protein
LIATLASARSEDAVALINGLMGIQTKTRFTVRDVLNSKWLGGAGVGKQEPAIPAKTVPYGFGVTYDEEDMAPRYRNYHGVGPVGLGLEMSMDMEEEAPVYRNFPGAATPLAPPSLARQPAFMDKSPFGRGPIA